jgi:sugar/nucleoside kinase (ribokinase family)
LTVWNVKGGKTRVSRGRRNAVVLCDLIADLSLRIGGFPVQAKDLQEVSYLELGPGGACNAAIVAARLGLPVLALGEVGRDEFGRVVVDGLRREGVDVAQVIRNPAARTPVAGVLVDPQSEPAYLGYAGQLLVGALPDEWRRPVQSAAAVYADGWAEHRGVPRIILEAFELARAAGAAVFFDPGPGNPRLEGGNGWHRDAAELATVVLVNEEEAETLTGCADPEAAARALARADRLAVVKRGPDGAILAKGDVVVASPAFPVAVCDATGAGDSVAGAMMYGVLRGLPLEALGALANATGAAKVQKLGTGHNVPTPDEIRRVLADHGEDAAFLLPRPAGV